MRPLFILRRKGIIVVSGTISEVEERTSTVTIVNDVYLPCSEKIEQRAVRAEFPHRNLSGLQLARGASVLATVRDDFRVEMLQEGAETPDRVYELEGFNIRYNGNFVFQAKEDRPEQSVFSGTILRTRSGTGKNGEPWAGIELGWKRNMYSESAVIYLTGKRAAGQAGKYGDGERAILVTGPKLVDRRNNSPYYMGQAIYRP